MGQPWRVDRGIWERPRDTAPQQDPMRRAGVSLPASGHVLRIIWPFVPVVVALALFSIASLDLLSAARAFVAGESQWSKGQKNAVLRLLRYGEDRDPADFEAYLESIAIPLGDHRARLELDRDEPDPERVHEGLIAGGNHPDDIPGMVRLYRNFRKIQEVDAAIRVWTAGDIEIFALHEQALALRRLIAQPGCSAECVAPVLRNIAQIDARLTPLERAFSGHLGQASRRVTRLLTNGSAVMAAALLMSAILLSVAPLRRERRLREALAQREEQLQLAVEGSNDGLWDWHLGRGELYFSPRCAQMLGYRDDELPHARETVLGLLHPSELSAFEEKLARHLRSGEPYDAEFRLRNRAGDYLWVRARGRLVRGAGRRRARMAGSLTDISDHKRYETQLFAEKERAQVTLQAIGDAVVTADVWGRVQSLNPAAEALTGWREAEAQGRPLSEVCVLRDEESLAPLPDIVTLALRQRWRSRSAQLVQRVGSGQPGQPLAVKPSVALIRDRAAQAIGVVVVLHDISQERAHAARLAYEASHDALTGLVNRAEFERRLGTAITRGRAQGATHTLMYLDLDQFKVVNDTCGHAAGDELIRQMAEVMRSQLRRGDTLARLGGDEFGVLLEHCVTADGERVAEGLRHAIASFRFAHRQRTFAVGASIGLVTLDRQTGSVAEALSAADAACYVAKEGGRNRVQVYHPMDSVVQARHGEMEWVSRVHAALAAGRFCLFAQEIVPVHSGALPETGRHVELLLRMVDERGRLVPPMAFVPACERYNLMPMIDRWVVETAFGTLAGRQAEIATCAINLSGSSLADIQFPDFVREQAQRFGIALDGICFEITETAAISNLAQAGAFIVQLQQLGCEFALDDFGAGMSSFTYLKHLPAAYLKIDGSFVRDMLADPVNLVMVEVIQRIGYAMGKKTIAEFVESEAMLERLRELGVDLAQGYHIAPPVPFAPAGPGAGERPALALVG
ncbi:PAS domain S-box protein [Cupriavidus necator]|uniref:PAS domain S-box protein n=1 Tax=Cupriavidus necator TaxID=106590 RepID=A0A1U9UST5_CUPNE|nr:EAL domain-containing protein [Cupriavidus necator]AQV95225.1 PAS domain S-box protein [Cupriavidus necator]